MLNLLFKSLFALVVLIIFIAGVVFDAKFLSQDQFSDKELKFSRVIQESVDFIPDRFSSHITLESTNTLRTSAQITPEQLNQITTTLDKALSLAKDSQICKGSTYSISPSYSYNDGARIISGQLVNFDIRCEFNKADINKYETLITSLNSLIAGNEFITMSLPALAQSSSSAIIAQNSELLHSKILKSAMAKATIYSKELGKNCVLNSVEFSTTNYPADYANIKATAAFTATPIESKKSQNLLATASYSCK